MKKGRTWLPLDAGFTRDPDVIRAGEAAGWLYLGILGQLRMTGSQGSITREEVEHLGIPRTNSRLYSLQKAGLLVPSDVDPDAFVVPAWASWQPDQARADYMRAYRRRQSKRSRNSHA
jgi:hypothetical protein